MKKCCVPPQRLHWQRQTTRTSSNRAAAQRPTRRRAGGGASAADTRLSAPWPHCGCHHGPSLAPHFLPSQLSAWRHSAYCTRSRVSPTDGRRAGCQWRRVAGGWRAGGSSVRRRCPSGWRQHATRLAGRQRATWRRRRHSSSSSSCSSSSSSTAEEAAAKQGPRAATVRRPPAAVTAESIAAYCRGREKKACDYFGFAARHALKLIGSARSPSHRTHATHSQTWCSTWPMKT